MPIAEIVFMIRKAPAFKLCLHNRLLQKTAFQICWEVLYPFFCHRKYYETECGMLSPVIRLEPNVPNMDFCLQICAGKQGYWTLQYIF